MFNLKRNILLLGLLFILNPLSVTAQDNSTKNNTRPYSPKKMLLASSSGTFIYGGSMLYLNQIWYKEYRTEKFHFFNDNQEWLQMDKIGHGFSAYYISQLAYHGLLWAGNSPNKSLWYGAGISALVLSSIEIFDGFSDGWGASWGDFTANTLGATLFVLQEKMWNQQRIKLKFSAFPSKYAQWRPEVLGSTFMEQFFKDYNGQTYWASSNLSSFNIGSNHAEWLNIAIGHSINGVLGGYYNPPTNESGKILPHYQRVRQFLIAPDIDLEKIKTKSKVVKTLLKLLNTVKVPAPALELSKSGVKWHWLYF